MEPEITERHAMTVESGTLTGKIQRIPLSGPILHELNPHENAVDGRVGANIDRGWAWIVAGSAVCAFATSSGNQIVAIKTISQEVNILYLLMMV
jgi:hypothetical protein